MAVDTELKRFSMLSFAGETTGLPPMLSFTTTPGGPAFRAQQLWLYTGISLDAPPEAPDSLPQTFLAIPIGIRI
jgi:hypothetical protein